MIKIRKYIILSVLLIILAIPIFFGIFIEYFTIRESNWFVVLIFIVGILVLLILGKLIEIYGYNDEIVEVIRKQDVLNAFINRSNRLIIWFFFPIIIIIEELIFRYYSIGILVHVLDLQSVITIFISSSIFSLFHIHIWFRYKNLMIFLINLGYPFLMGLYFSYIFLKLGIIPCILIHYFIALFSYYNIYRRYFRKKIQE